MLSVIGSCMESSGEGEAARSTGPSWGVQSYQKSLSVSRKCGRAPCEATIHKREGRLNSGPGLWAKELNCGKAALMARIFRWPGPHGAVAVPWGAGCPGVSLSQEAWCLVPPTDSQICTR